jgi:hypothetical protein
LFCRRLYRKKIILGRILLLKEWILLFFPGGKKGKKVLFKVSKLVLANVDIRVHKFLDFFVLTVESLAELVVV